MSDSEETKEILERIADAFESFGSNLDEKYPKEAVRPGTIVRANRVDSLGVVTDAFYGELDEDNQKIIIYTILLFPKRNYLNQRRDEQYYISDESSNQVTAYLLIRPINISELRKNLGGGIFI